MAFISSLIVNEVFAGGGGLREVGRQESEAGGCPACTWVGEVVTFSTTGLQLGQGGEGGTGPGGERALESR